MSETTTHTLISGVHGGPRVPNVYDPCRHVPTGNRVRFVRFITTDLVQVMDNNGNMNAEPVPASELRVLH